jgi:hypothetical protein
LKSVFHNGLFQSDHGARSPNKILENYCLDAVHRPLHPSDCLKVPEPLRPESRPTLVAVTPLELLIALTAPFGLTRPLTPWPMILPLVTTTAFRLLPEQVVPTLLTTHAPSKLLAPLLCEARRGSSASGLLRRAGLSDSLARGGSREPESDFSSLPILPPALPDCACAGPNATKVNIKR